MHSVSLYCVYNYEGVHVPNFGLNTVQLESFESISVVQLEVFGRSPEGCGGVRGWG